MGDILLMGGGALARDYVEMFGAERFAGAFVESEFDHPDLDGLPIYSSLKDFGNRSYVLAVSDVSLRRRFEITAAEAGMRPCSPLVSDRAVVAGSARIGAGCVICHHAVIGPRCIFDQNVLIMHNVVVGHDSRLHQNCIVCAGASLGGGVILHDGCFIGPNGAIAPQLSIAANSFLAAGAVCLRDVERTSLVVGNPSRVVGR